jgi:hypothetical protein
MSIGALAKQAMTLRIKWSECNPNATECALSHVGVKPKMTLIQ